MNNKTSIKSLFSDSIIYGLSNSLGKFISFMLIPLYTKYLTPTDFGTFSLINTFSILISIIAILGLDSAVYRFYFENEDENEKVKKINNWIILQFSFTLVLSVLILLFKDHILKYILQGNNGPLGILPIVYIIGYMLLNILSTIINAYFRLYRKPWHSLVVNIVSTIFSISLSIYFVVYLNKGIIGLLYAQLLNLFCVNVIAFFFLVNRFTIHNFSWKQNIPLLKYGVNILPANLLTIGFQFYITQLIHYKLGKEELGLFQMGTNFSVILGVLTSSIAAAWSPYIFGQLKDPTFKQTFNKAYNLYLCVVGFICIAISIFATEILIIMTNANYYNASWVVSLQTLSVFISSLNIFYIMGISISKKMKFYTLINVITTSFTVLISYMFINAWGINGVCVTMLIGQIFNILLIHYKSEKLYPLFNTYKFTIVGLVSTICIIFAWKVFEINNLLYSIIFKGISLIIILVLSLVFLNKKYNFTIK